MSALRHVAAAAAVFLLLALAPRTAHAQGEFATDFFLDDCQFSSQGGNRFYFTLEPGDRWTFEGEEDGEALRLEVTVLDEVEVLELPTEDGETREVVARVIEEHEWADGETVEVSRNFFARCRETGDIYYFGEDVDIYEGGVVVSHDGEWRVGEDGALPGLIMPATFLPGARYVQETAPGIAMDRAEHVAMGLDVDIPAGSFEDCVEVIETSPLDPGSDSLKIYCPGVGLVVDDVVELVSFERGDAPERSFASDFALEDCKLVTRGENPWFHSLNPGDEWYYEGEEDDTPISLLVTVLDELETVVFALDGGAPTPVMARVIEEREWEDGELVEVSRNFFVRCLETDDVFYLGEDVDDYEDGVVVGHDGAWRAGTDGAVGGLIMPGRVLPGAAYFQEVAPGIALDRAVHAEVGVTVVVPAGRFDGCLEIFETTPLDPTAESTKIYCPGVGMAVDDALQLVSYSRVSVPQADNLRLGDVAPGSLTPDQRWEIVGDDEVNIADVVVMLRAAVGLHVLDCAP